ncbi:16S rRNA (cytosine(967)-C(5))-methyltransferase RsmB [Bacillus massiliigorillae]|uniref:16S rRNA (cytosine(967)-C(5))-methyltransferase RsmB n=1 Tax=Bacillus massiliigorillae TaxID=1243664 RepID=UPI00039BDB4C|nr:16S rRNA (cytosine(967)-C(5))-methyltransferase RsmB [Bacillus massiliigorillae]
MSKKTKSKNVRELALELILSVEKNQSYSNLALNSVMKKNNLSPADGGLLTEITYGTIQRKLTLDYFLEPFLNNKNKIDDWVIILLRLSLYQMHYLDKVPDHAVIFEAVEIAKRRGHKGISSMVNGVLRSIQRKGVPSLDLIKDEEERVAIETSHPLWLVKRWASQYGLDKTREMCAFNLLPPQQTARINAMKTNRDEVIKQLEQEGYAVEASKVVPDAIICLRGNLAHSKAFEDGLLTIQDESSMLVSYALDAHNDDKVLDCCAAPGGKTTSIAEKLTNGNVVALDLHEHKVKLINQQATRLGLTNITTVALDARKATDTFQQDYFDKILVDAPCSGLGVMRRKPDVKYTKSEGDIHRLAIIQMDILNTAASLLKPGGTLVYSTCTVDKDENEKVVQHFLQQHADFVEDNDMKNRLPESVRPFVSGNKLQLFPQDVESDGFYIACFRKRVNS